MNDFPLATFILHTSRTNSGDTVPYSHHINSVTATEDACLTPWIQPPNGKSVVERLMPKKYHRSLRHVPFTQPLVLVLQNS